MISKQGIFLFVVFIIGLFNNVWGRDKYVSCGSVIKLLNSQFEVRLHSHDVKYGSGSGQQSVTGTTVKEDHNSHWVVKGNTSSHCTRGEPIACGQRIRLEHSVTETNLHSHHFRSPLSDQQEVSTFGTDGEGDTGDNWEVVCDTDLWIRDQPVKFRHVDTQMYLAATGNVFGRPIHGQNEVVCSARTGRHSDWKTMEGVFIEPSEKTFVHADQSHTEL